MCLGSVVGLETIELVMNVEDAFGIAIPDELASEIGTVGQLNDTVMELIRCCVMWRPAVGRRGESYSRIVSIPRDMQALSIRQPFAELILRGTKTKEYRSRPTQRIGERFFIYASKGRAVASSKLLVVGEKTEDKGQRAAEHLLETSNQQLATTPWSTDLSVATPPGWLVELWEQVRIIEAEEHEEWPRGVIVGSAVIERCEEVASAQLLAPCRNQRKTPHPNPLPEYVARGNLATSNQQLATSSPPMFAWHLTDVRRARKLRKPSGRPQPVWFRPFGG
jgi:hypothetical protein